ncbi:hypothetical protein DFH08DRAFT_749076 [Mycena albidolilacea]|uniref:S-adenosylmethionine-dependent methyltransferase n=1 Tax=Mycena albidolilacea TaxID=1033008 RepID=A0AAD6ZSD6_9AGAR|nr:hypothetical protein DFH08DRAFT_749076 [Mycena albidolilacea]
MLLNEPPSLRLPPIRTLSGLPPDGLIECIEALQILYSPGVRGSKIRRRFSSNPSTESPSLAASFVSAPDLEKIAALRADEFERAHTIRWLTSLLNNIEKLQGTPSEVDSVISRAASLLANCGGASSAGAITRTLSFPSARGPISITLRDIPLENGDIASVGAQTWGGACVLSELIASHPADFGLLPACTLRALELGAGTGLAGLMLAKVAQSMDVGVEVVSTDFYPSVLTNLAGNIAVAFPFPTQDQDQQRSSTSISVSSHFLDWSALPSHGDDSEPPLDAPFDVILGADVVYEPDHTPWIHACVSRFLRRDKTSQFHLVLPLRRTHTFESDSVERAFTLPTTQVPALTILSRETIVCDAEDGGKAGEEVEYVYYRIGWKLDQGCI